MEGDMNYDDDSDDGNSQAQEHEREEIKHSESSVNTPQSSESSSNNRVHTPPPMCVTQGKQYRNTKYNRVEEKLLKKQNPSMMKMRCSVWSWLWL